MVRGGLWSIATRLVPQGQLLVLSVRTVESHRATLQQKLHLYSRAELVRYALGRGLLAAA